MICRFKCVNVATKSYDGLFAKIDKIYNFALIDAKKLSLLKVSTEFIILHADYSSRS